MATHLYTIYVVDWALCDVSKQKESVFHYTIINYYIILLYIYSDRFKIETSSKKPIFILLLVLFVCSHLWTIYIFVEQICCCLIKIFCSYSFHMYNFPVKKLSLPLILCLLKHFVIKLFFDYFFSKHPKLMSDDVDFFPLSQKPDVSYFILCNI